MFEFILKNVHDARSSNESEVNKSTQLHDPNFRQSNPSPSQTTFSKSFQIFLDNAAPRIFIGSIIIAVSVGLFLYSQTISTRVEENNSLSQTSHIYNEISKSNNTESKLPIETVVSKQFNAKEIADSSKKTVFPTMTPLVSQATPTLSPTAIPTIATGTGPYACDPKGNCNNYADPTGYGQCPKTFADRKCLNECNNVNIRCVN